MLTIIASGLTGCATVEARRVVTITDSSHMKVGVFLDDVPPNYRLKFEGAITGWKKPGDSFSFHTECSGKFEGVIHAYKAVGQTDNGDEALFYMGEKKYSFRTDGKNLMYKGESYDAIVKVSSSFHRYKNIPFGGEKTHYPLYTGPCGLMDLKIQWPGR